MVINNGAAAPTTVNSEDIQPLTVEESQFIAALRAGMLAEFLSNKSNGSIQKPRIVPLDNSEDGQLQFAVALTCLLFGRAVIPYTLHGTGHEDFEYCVTVIHDFMVASRIKVDGYPLVPLNYPASQP